MAKKLIRKESLLAKKDALRLCAFAFNLLMLCSSCQVGQRYDPPVVDVPCEWNSPHPCVECDLDNFQWWKELNDPQLECLLERASEQNLDLFIAATRILEARLEKKGKEAEAYPRIDGSAGYYHVFYSRDALQNGVLNNQIPIRRNVNFFEVGFDAEWEIDLFGVTRYQAAALQAKIEAEEEGFCDLWVTLSAEIARNYVELRGLQLRIELLTKQIAAQEDSVHLLESLEVIGGAGTIDVNMAKGQVHLLRAEQLQLQFLRDKTIHRIAILLGEEPSELYCELQVPLPLPTLPLTTPCGIPSEVLRRRADVAKAERLVAAATENKNSAIAQLFPRLSLNGFIGAIGTQLPTLFESPSQAWAAGPQLLFPIFNSRLLKQNVEYQCLKIQEAYFEYYKVVLGALEESENAIAALHYERERNGALKEVSASQKQTVEMTSDLYESGVKSYLDVINAQNEATKAEELFIQSQVAVLVDYIALYKALGGSW